MRRRIRAEHFRTENLEDAKPLMQLGREDAKPVNTHALSPPDERD